jgi:hypothetical protein
LRSIRLQWLKQSHNLVGYKKVDEIDAKPHRSLGLKGEVMYQARFSVEMHQHIEELTKRLVVQDHIFRRESESNDEDDESNGEDESEDEDGSVMEDIQPDGTGV